MIPYDKLLALSERYKEDINAFRLTGDLGCLMGFLESVVNAENEFLKEDFFKALTSNEKIAFTAITEEIGASGNISVVKMIQKTNLSRPVWTSLLQKMEKYGAAIVKAQGVKGTYIEFREEVLSDES